MKQLLWVLTGSLFFTACGTSKKTETKPTASVESSKSVTNSTVSKTEQALLHPTRRATFHASRTLFNDIVHTKLEVKPDWEKSYLYGTASITAKPHFYPQSELVLDAKGMEILSVKIKGSTLKYTYEKDVLTIQLDKKYTRNDTYTVVIDYISKPDERESGGSDAITSDKGLYFINPTGKEGKKMPQIWTQGETESNSVWFPTIDSPNAKSTQETFITVADKYVTLSNGKLISSTKNKDGSRTDHWKQDLQHAPYLFMLGIGEFKIVKDQYIRKNGSKMDVFYYVEPEWEQYAKDIFGETPKMIGFFSDVLGVEYPWDKFHQIVVRDYVSGAMENTGAVVFGDFLYKTKGELIDNNDQSIIAHELFHHWFGDLVTAESWSNLPLNEAFANYSQYMWDEFRYGKDEADFNAQGEENGYLQKSKMDGNHNLIWYDYDSREDMFDAHSYNKGGRILHMLRKYVGDEAFYASLKKYLTDNAYTAVDFDYLRHAFEEVTGEDMNWFFQQWFTAKGHPVLDYTIKQENDTIKVAVQQKQNVKDFPIYKLPYVIAINDANGLHKHKVTLSTLDTTFFFPVKGEVLTVIPDFEEMLLSVSKENKSAEYYINQYYVGENWRTRNNALIYGYKSSRFQDLILDAMDDKYKGIRSKALDNVNRLKDGNIQKGLDKVVVMAQKDSASLVRVAALRALKKMNYTDLATICINRIDKDSSYKVIGEALSMLNTIDVTKAMEYAKKLEELKSSDVDLVLADMYLESNNPNTLQFIKESLLSGRMNGFNEVSMVNTLTRYGVSNGLDELSAAVDLLNIVDKDGGMYAKMFMKGNFDYISTSLEQAQKELNEMIKTGEASKEIAAEYQAKINEIMNKIKK